MVNPHASPYFMGTAAQALQNTDRVVEVRRFAENFSVDRDQRVRRQHYRVG